VPHDLAVIRRGDSAYEATRRAASWNADTPDRFPDIIVQARSAQDVVTAVQLAGEKGWAIAIRSGGHNFACNPIRNGGMLLDLSRLDTVEVDARAMRAVVGPGCKGDQVNTLLAKQNLFFPIGHCRGVGLGGYLLQGGYGWNSRAVGLACENVVGIDYVGADGVPRHASPDENADVYWAARGAGPGFFGIVTGFHLKLHRRPRVVGSAVAFYPLAAMEEVYPWLHGVGPRVPPSVELQALMSRKTDFVRGAGISLVATVFADSWRQARADLAFLKTRPRRARVATPFVPMSVRWMTGQVMGHYPDRHKYAVDNMWTGAPIEKLMPGIRRIAETLPVAPSHMLWLNWAPPPARADMAYSCEDQIYIALYGIWKDAADRPAAASWAIDNMRAMAPLSTGIQLADENLGARPARFLSDAHMARLDTLRATHDPAGRFHSYLGRLP
jgi:FAD/FMN-containing dehydrogenase